MTVVENLAEVSTNENNKEAPFYRKAYYMCKKHEDHTDVGGLLVKLFGAPED